DGVDAGLADELEAAACRELAGGAAAVGARNLLWASSLSDTPEQAERRLIQAIQALLGSGQTNQAAGLPDQLEACRVSPTRDRLLGTIDWERGQAASAEHWLRRAATGATSPSDNEAVAWAWAQLGEMFATHGRGDEAVDAANNAL